MRKSSIDKAEMRVKITNDMIGLFQNVQGLENGIEPSVDASVQQMLLSSGLKDRCVSYNHRFPREDIRDMSILADAYDSLFLCIYQYGYVQELQELQHELYKYLECFPPLQEDPDYEEGDSYSKLFQNRLKRLHEKISEDEADFANCTTEAVNGLSRRLDDLGYVVV